MGADGKATKDEPLAGSLSPEDAETVSQVAGVVSIVDWYVDRYRDGRPLGLRIHVSIS